VYIQKLEGIFEEEEKLKKIAEKLGFSNVEEFIKYTKFPDSTLRAFKKDRPEKFKVIAYGAYILRIMENKNSVKLYREYEVPEI